MSPATPSALAYTDTELRSYLPSGWGIVPGARGVWSGETGRWQIEIYDGADNTWTLAVERDDAEERDRLAALKQAIDRLNRRALGRKSILTG